MNVIFSFFTSFVGEMPVCIISNKTISADRGLPVMMEGFKPTIFGV